MIQPVLLNNVDHHDLCVHGEGGTWWGDGVNEVTVFPTELEAISREYAVVFRPDEGGGLRASALLGFAAGENLFVGDDGWAARSLPALMQRGPFSIGLPNADRGGEPMIHVDLDDPRVARGKGEPIFAAHGGNTPYLDHVAGVLRTIYAGTQVAPAMIAAFAEAKLFDTATLEATDADGRSVTVPDVTILSAERFAALDGAALARLHDGDFLRCAVWVMSSLGNLAALVERKRVRDARG